MARQIDASIGPDDIRCVYQKFWQQKYNAEGTGDDKYSRICRKMHNCINAMHMTT